MKLTITFQVPPFQETTLGCFIKDDLLVLSREWMGMGVAGIIIGSDYGSFPPSLHSAPASLWFPQKTMKHFTSYSHIQHGFSVLNMGCRDLPRALAHSSIVKAWR